MNEQDELSSGASPETPDPFFNPPEPKKRWALLRGGVVQVIVEQAGQPTLEDFEAVDVTDRHVGPGDTTSDGGQTFSPPAAPFGWVVSYFAFRKRFTQTEQVAVQLYCVINPTDDTNTKLAKATLQAFVADAQAHGVVHLDGAEAQTGVNWMASQGILDGATLAERQARASTILNTPASPAELPEA